MAIGNGNIITARLDPARLALVGKIKKRRESMTNFIRRIIDIAAEKEGVCNETDNIRK